VQYKNNMALGASAQAITAMPDVRVVRLLPTDEFMVLACDGIWEVMTSQEVVDFVRPRIVGRSGDTPLSSICEELCDACVASEDEMNDPESDGTGCDNMTVMIVVFKQDAILRSAATKRAALEKQRSVVEGGGRKHRRSSGSPSPQPYMNSQSSHLLRPKRIRLDSAHLPLDP
jgi:protein phosphatase 1G